MSLYSCIPQGVKRLFHRARSTSRFLAGWSLSDSKSELALLGWFRSVYERMPVDRTGAPLPWYTYSAISFLEERLKPEMKVFEFGSGNSTLWWAERVAEVVSCEHDVKWAKELRSKLPENVTYISEKGAGYEASISPFNDYFDIVIVDGVRRNECAEVLLPALKQSGVVVWDNADRTEYESGFRFLAENGFKRIDFTGMGPINRYGWTTAVFYRAGSCLGI